MEMLGGSDLEGIVFLGVAWFIWIMATFFLSRTSKERLKIAFIVLMMIILSPYEFTFLDFQINIAAFSLYIYLFVEVVQHKKKSGLYLFLSSFIIMLAYVSFLMMELYDPVWVVFDRKWMVGFILVYICLLLEGSKKLRFYPILLGTLQGELIFSIILNRFSFAYPIGSLSFFDTIGTALFLLSTWSFLGYATVFIEHHTNHSGRGKQKTS